MTEEDNPRPRTPPDRRPYRKTPPATPAVQAWLDGEETRDHLTQPGERENVELWDKLNSEAEQLRRRTTPIHLQQRILSSLPGEAGAVTPEATHKSVSLSTSVAVLAGAGLLVAGAVLGALFFGR
ncbi:MAG TPA: hypothetical protein VIF83_00360 [Gemmatimonadaceae bacterium]|jgi:hypothetical protein